LARALENGRRLLRGYLKRLRGPSGREERLAKELRLEQKKRRQAEGELRRLRDAGGPAGGRTHSLPEPDRSVSRVRIFRSLISSYKPGRMLELGAGPGTFSLAASRMGWEATAVDVRTMRTPDAEAAEDPKRAELIKSVNWVEADVREFPVHAGEYDLVCIFGLLHHLEVEDQKALLERCSHTLTLLTVRVAAAVVDVQGPYEGMYRREKGETREERDQIPQASWGNELDFWHTEESLLRLMRDCGYSKVMAMRPPHRPNYTFYLCLPSLEPPAGEADPAGASSPRERPAQDRNNLDRGR